LIDDGDAAIDPAMPNCRRLYVPGATYFFTLNLRDRRRRLLTDEIVSFRASWAEVGKAHPFETIAAVVLPEHTHFIWRLPDGDDRFSTRIRRLKSGLTRRLWASERSAGRKGERNVWQRRFWEHMIRNAEDLDAHIACIHWNPVKHALVKDPDDWPHSTWHEWKKEYGRPINAPPEDCKPAHLGEP
jgi:putative transposase